MRRRRRQGPPCLWVAALLPVVFGLSPERADGQRLEELAQQCGGEVLRMRARCMDLALAVQAIRGAMGLSLAGGSDLPGTASTLGHRLQNSPRFSLAARFSLVRAPVPDLLGSSSVPAGDGTFLVPGAHLVGTVGTLDGFSLAPSVGGIGSLDLFGSIHFLFPSTSDGFEERLNAWGLGARVGVLRESFTLPGVSVSLGYRSLEEIEWGRWDEGDDAEASISPSVTSFRATVGKDILGVGVLAGMGWDRHSSTGGARVRDPDSETVGDVPVGSLETDRKLFFLGGSMTYVVLQISAEAGWAEGFSEAFPSGEQGRFGPSSRSVFASLSFRLNL
jgi:hypothetical protein